MRNSEVFMVILSQIFGREGRANMALADFIAPKDSGRQDYIEKTWGEGH